MHANIKCTINDDNRSDPIAECESSMSTMDLLHKFEKDAMNRACSSMNVEQPKFLPPTNNIMQSRFSPLKTIVTGNRFRYGKFDYLPTQFRTHITRIHYNKLHPVKIVENRLLAKALKGAKTAG